MIDITTLYYPDRCPRCRDRRVAIVDREHGFWRCIPSEMPTWAVQPGMIIEHDTNVNSDFVEDDNDPIRVLLGIPTIQGAQMRNANDT